jgi:hypothetical protein
MPSSEKRFVTEVENVSNILHEHPNNQRKGNSAKNLFESAPARENKKDVECETKCRQDYYAKMP